ncbi:putative ankyrin repeat protein RF_0381 [Phymastichus coffea]|uniref:putative ankyrin repeat protein RF_0381 n=1 Tax=Phymastichus coffea TaxID=108790 RepID=UPI00273AB7B4|nr:putative ankyrin repeat protein RF_0381 [Phymastichus coffea]
MSLQELQQRLLENQESYDHSSNKLCENSLKELLNFFPEKTCETDVMETSQTESVHSMREQKVYSDELKDILPFLMKCNGDINYRDENGQTILHVYLASDASNFARQCREESKKARSVVVEKLRGLIYRGASVNAVDHSGRTPLHIIGALKNKLALIEPMVEFFSNTYACDNEGNTVLHTVVYDDLSLVRYEKIALEVIYQEYLNCDAENDALLAAVRGLLSKGVDPNSMNNDGMTSLQYAVSYCKVSLLQAFKEHGADFSVITSDGNNLLTLVVTDQETVIPEARIAETIKFLVEQGCDINWRNPDGYSLMHLAAKWKIKPLVYCLIQLGADLNLHTRHRHMTPLHMAILHVEQTPPRRYMDKFKLIIQALTFAGADWYARDDEGDTPLDYAIAKTMNYVQSSIIVDINDPRAKRIFKEHDIDSFVILRAIELESVGFPIDSEYEVKLKEETKIMKKHREKCMMEVEALKTVVINSSVSLYQFMHLNWRHQCSLVNYVPRRLQGAFPIYSTLIMNICFDAKFKKLLIEPAMAAFRHITAANLPDVCLEYIFNCLNNETLRVLIKTLK